MNKLPVIDEVVISMIDDEFKKSRQDALDRNVDVKNPNYFKQGKVISIESNENHIVCKITQPGLSKNHRYYTISVAWHYEQYKPYYDEWLKPRERERKMKSIGI